MAPRCRDEYDDFGRRGNYVRSNCHTRPKMSPQIHRTQEAEQEQTPAAPESSGAQIQEHKHEQSPDELRYSSGQNHQLDSVSTASARSHSPIMLEDAQTSLQDVSVEAETHPPSENQAIVTTQELSPGPHSSNTNMNAILSFSSLSLERTESTKMIEDEIKYGAIAAAEKRPCSPGLQTSSSPQYEHIRRRAITQLAQTKALVEAAMQVAQPTMSSRTSSLSADSTASQAELAKNIVLTRTRSSSEPPRLSALARDPLFHDRACSKPRPNGIAVTIPAGNQAANGETSGGMNHAGNVTNPQQPAKYKGKERVIDNGNSEASSGSGHQLKRRRRDGPGNDDEDGGGRLPCFFYLADQDNHRKCQYREYKYISQLQRHLQGSTHLWYACEKCYVTFTSSEDLSHHQNEKLCVKRCRIPSCRRHCLRQSSPASLQCACVTSSLKQWECLFRLKFPETTVPTIEQQPSMLPSEAHSPATAGSDEFTQDLETLINSTSGVVAGDSVVDTTEAHGPPPLQPPLENTDLFVQLMQQYEIILDLQKQIALLEQRLQQPESVLAVVWEAFVGREWHKTTKGSALHRMVSRCVPGVIPTTADCPEAPVPPITEHTGMNGDFEWSPLQQALSAGGFSGNVNPFVGSSDSTYGCGASK